MNQTEFISQLRQVLGRHGLSDIEDILSDFSEHFATGLALGKDEHEIAAELGDPDEIAAQYAGEQGRPSAGIPDQQSTGTPDPQSTGKPQDTGPRYVHVERPEPFRPSRGSHGAASSAVPPAGRQPSAAPGPGTTGGYVFVEDSRGIPRPAQIPPQGGPVPPQGGPVPPQGTSVPPQGTSVPPQGTPVPPMAGKPANEATGTGSYVRTEQGYAWDSRGGSGAGSYGTGSGAGIPAASADSGVMVILLILLNLFIALPVFLTAIGILVGVWAAGFGVGAGAVALFIAAAAETGMMAVVLVLFAIALTALTILLLITAYGLSILFVRGTGAYVRWNRRTAKGGTAA